MDYQKKLEELLKIREKAQSRFDNLKKHYRGVIHESASSELKHSEFMVAQEYLRNLEQEIKNLKEKIKIENRGR